LSPHPGQVKAELNSDGTDSVDPDTGVRLSDRIHRMLFSGQDAEQEAAHV
jgi:NitT/TauT family transport system ATP-binding protein